MVEYFLLIMVEALLRILCLLQKLFVQFKLLALLSVLTVYVLIVFTQPQLASIVFTKLELPPGLSISWLTPAAFLPEFFLTINCFLGALIGFGLPGVLAFPIGSPNKSAL